MHWDQFTDACPEFARLARSRFGKDEPGKLRTGVGELVPVHGRSF